MKKAAAVRLLAINLVGLLGLAAFLFGLSQIYRPAAFIAGGILCTAWAIVKSGSAESEGGG